MDELFYSEDKEVYLLSSFSISLRRPGVALGPKWMFYYFLTNTETRDHLMSFYILQDRDLDSPEISTVGRQGVTLSGIHMKR